MSHPYTLAKEDAYGSWYWNVYDPTGRRIACFPVHVGMEQEAEEHARKFFAPFTPWEF